MGLADAAFAGRAPGEPRRANRTAPGQPADPRRPPAAAASAAVTRNKRNPQTSGNNFLSLMLPIAPPYVYIYTYRYT